MAGEVRHQSGAYLPVWGPTIGACLLHTAPEGVKE